MKIVIAPDSFKGSLTASQACRAISEGVAGVFSDADLIQIPMADGGEGTVDALVASTGGSFKKVNVLGPLCETICAKYGILGQNELTPGAKTVVIEMSAAAGLPLVVADQRNPLYTTTYGLGQMIIDALDNGCRNFIIGIGGSATNDCGCGMAQALGVKFLDEQQHAIGKPLNGELLARISDVDIKDIDSRLTQCSVIVASDVTNPLLGVNGASRTYATQKGACPDEVELLEKNVASVINVIESKLNVWVRNIPGSGAAGGLGAGLLAFLNARLKSGIDIVIEYSGFEKHIIDADLIITGEGQVNHTSAQGKTISGILKCASKNKIPVIVIAGCLGKGYESILDLGAKAVFSICSDSISSEQAMKNAESLLGLTAQNAISEYVSSGRE